MSRITMSIITALVLFTSCQSGEAVVYPLEVGDRLFYVEIADSDAERREGLMYRQTLAADRGMLFVFEDSAERSFWMKNTYIDLSIAFIDENGRIVSIKDMTALDETSVPSDYPAKYALEVNQGAFDSAGVHVHDVIDLSTIPGL